MIKIVKIGFVIFIVFLAFSISYYTNSHDIRDITREFSKAQESLSQFIHTLTPDTTTPPVSLTFVSQTVALGDNIVVQYTGDPNSFKDLHFTVTNNLGEAVFTKAQLTDDKILMVELSKKINPGKYKLIIKLGDIELINSFFYLGTVVLDNQQLQYTTGDTYVSDMVIFDDNGNLFCDEGIRFEMVNTLSGSVDPVENKNGLCDKKAATPYHLQYKTSTAGTYILKNPGGETSTSLIQQSAFDVTDTTSELLVMRESPVFVSANKEYEEKITVTARDNFEGVLSDLVPASFSVSKSSNFSLESPTVLLNESTIHLRKPFNGDFPVTLKFGEGSDDPIISNGYKNYGVKAHDGIDFALPEGTPVFAADDGKVIEFPTKLSAYGNTVVLEHQWGGRTFYGHLSKINVNIGQKVGKGDIIGFSGHTGLVTGPHLHFGLDLKNSDVNNGYLGKIDPTSYLSDNNDLNISIQKLTWDISLRKGEKKELGYMIKLPEDDYGYRYFELGPINIVNKNNDGVFKDNQRWTLIKE